MNNTSTDSMVGRLQYLTPVNVQCSSFGQHDTKNKTEKEKSVLLHYYCYCDMTAQFQTVTSSFIFLSNLYFYGVWVLAWCAHPQSRGPDLASLHPKSPLCPYIEGHISAGPSAEVCSAWLTLPAATLPLALSLAQLETANLPTQH